MSKIEPKKSLGQHWLEDKASLEAICDAAEVSPKDVVLEVGPGEGSLTASLLSRGAEVVAVELDERLAGNLKKRFKEKAFTLNMLSILDFDFGQLPANYKLVANIPYYLTNHLLRLLTEISNKPSVCVLLVQKEVAERVAAKPGEMSVISVAAQLYYQASLGVVVSAHLFTPPPKVNSQILILKKRAQLPLEVKDEKQFFKIVKAGFSARRKKLRSSLAGGLGISKDEAERLLRSAGIDPNLRAQNLSLDDWYKLYKEM